MEKVPILLVGGKGHNLPPDLRHRFDLAHIEVDQAVIPPGIAPDAMAIVGLGAVPGGLWDQAQVMARARDVPITRIEYGRELADHLRRFPPIKKILDRQGSNQNRTEQEPKKASEVKQEAATDIGLSDDDVWGQYGPKLIEGVKLLFNTGDKKHEDDFLEDLAKYAGVPAGAAKRVLNRLDEHSVLVNIAGSQTWQLIWSQDGLQVDPDTEPVEPEPPPPKAREDLLSQRVNALTGLHPGPYKSKYQIAQTLALYKEFDTKDGKPMSSTPALRVVEAAIEVEYIEEKDGEFFVHQDDSVTLTRREENSTPGPASAPAATPPTVEKKVSPKDFSLVGKKAPPEPEKDVFTESQIRELVLPAPKVDIPLAKLEMLKGIIAIVHWDTCAINTIHKKFDRKKVARELIDRRLFTQNEWDAYAWETIKKFTFLQAAEALSETPPAFEDEKCICKDCHQEFVDTKDRKTARFRRFGRASTPRRCFECHKKHKASQTVEKESDDNYDPRLPING